MKGSDVMIIINITLVILFPELISYLNKHSFIELSNLCTHASIKFFSPSPGTKLCLSKCFYLSWVTNNFILCVQRTEVGGYKSRYQGYAATGSVQQWTFFLGNDFNNPALDSKGKKENKVNGFELYFSWILAIALAPGIGDITFTFAHFILKAIDWKCLLYPFVGPCIDGIKWMVGGSMS